MYTRESREPVSSFRRMATTRLTTEQIKVLLRESGSIIMGGEKPNPYAAAYLLRLYGRVDEMESGDAATEVDGALAAYDRSPGIFDTTLYETTKDILVANGNPPIDTEGWKEIIDGSVIAGKALADAYEQGLRRSS